MATEGEGHENNGRNSGYFVNTRPPSHWVDDCTIYSDGADVRGNGPINTNVAL